MYEDPESKLGKWNCCKKFKSNRENNNISFWVGKFWQIDKDLVDERVMIEECPFCNKKLPDRTNIDQAA